MGTFLFRDIIFGPVFSRRLGLSLGLNLLPVNKKICSFNCIYCECGKTHDVCCDFVSVKHFKKSLEERLYYISEKNIRLDALTFAGNGEPTLHPEFENIINITIKLRDKYMPMLIIAVLSNSTTLNNASVFNALQKIDFNIMKIDAGSEKMFRIINNPLIDISLDDIVNKLQNFNGNLTIQTLFLKGKVGNEIVDNTTEHEISLLAKHLSKIKPRILMLYSFDRDTPVETLTVVDKNELKKIASVFSELLPESKIYTY